MVWSNTGSAPTAPEQEQSKSNLVRLVEDKEIVKRIELDEISMPATSDSANNIDTESQTAMVGSEYPIIRINDIVIPRKNIKSMTIYCVDFLPVINLSLMFNNSNIMHKNMPKDGDIVSVYMRAGRNDALTFVRNDYLIYSAIPSNSNFSSYTTMNISGELFIPGFNAKKNAIGYIGTSKDILKNIARDYGIGFAYNDFDNTDDMQTWICCNDTIKNFVNGVVRHAWKNETSFFNAWVDVYYNLCFVNVNKFLLSNENEEDIDVTLATNTVDVIIGSNDSQGNEKDMLFPKILSNIGKFKGSPFYIEKWTPTNTSSAISMEVGYQINSKTYIHNPTLYKSKPNDCFEELVNIPAYDQDKTKSHILLRGRATYSKSENPDDEMERANHNFVDTYNKVQWCGVEYMMNTDESDTASNNSWSGNVHKNYARAECHNEINIKELSKMFITVQCDGLCLQVMRGERVPVIIEYSTNLDMEDNGKNEEGEVSSTSRMYTGYYIVDSIEYSYKPSPSLYSNFSTTFVLKRREWPTPEQI